MMSAGNEVSTGSGLKIDRIYKIHRMGKEIQPSSRLFSFSEILLIM
jgi:hypothetical protein